MAITTFSYATQSDLKNYFRYSDFDQKVQIYATKTAANIHYFYDVGYADTLFINGEELDAAEANIGAVTEDGEWFWDSTTGELGYYNDGYTNKTIHTQVVETGVDFATFIDQQLVNASLELHNLMDGRFETPLPPAHQGASVTNSSQQASTTITPEYDPIIIKSVCYIAAANLIRSKDPQDEQAQSYYDFVTNAEGTGLIDRLNEGKIKLSFEVTENSRKGSIRELVRTGSMFLADLDGEFTGGHNGYDMLKITCTTLGAYGVAKCKVEYYGDDKIFGSEQTDLTVTGGFDDWGGLSGLRVRFQGTSMAVNDIWEIEAMSGLVESTNTVTNSIQLSRN